MRVTMRTFQLAVRGLPDLRNAPQTMDFTMRGQTFTADVTPDPDGGSCATVRGRGDCFTEADPAGTAQGPCGGDELMVFGAGRPTVRPGTRGRAGARDARPYHDIRLRQESRMEYDPRTDC